MLIIVTDKPPKKKRVQSPTKTSNASFYLGKPAEKTRRLAALESLAELHHTTVSGLIQMIADGTIKLCK